VICSASWPGELPLGTKPVVPWAGASTVTTTAAIAATIATTPAVTAMTTVRRFPGRPCPCLLGGSEPTAGNGAVEGSDAYHGPEKVLPPESLVTHATVPTGALTAQTAGQVPVLIELNVRFPGGLTVVSRTPPVAKLAAATAASHA
jgi:hypothetical protein